MGKEGKGDLRTGGGGANYLACGFAAASDETQVHGELGRPLLQQCPALLLGVGKVHQGLAHAGQALVRNGGIG